MAADRRNAAIPLILLAGWINLKIFLFYPLTIYISNAEEMRVGFHTLVSLYAIPFLACMAIVAGLGLALPRGLRRFYVAVLAAIGVLLWLQGDVLLWDYGTLDGTFIDWQREAWKGYVDTPIWVAVIVAAVSWRRRLLPMVQSLCLILFAVQVGSLWFLEPDPRTEPGEKLGRSTTHMEPSERLFRFAATENIIHIVLDGFQSDIFEEIVEDSKRYRDALQGFTFFKEATTSSSVTYLSVPSFISATTYQNHMPVWRFRQQALEGRNIVKVVANAGYQVDVASATDFLLNFHRDGSYYRIPQPFRGKEETEKWHAGFMLDLSLFRCAPHFIKRAIYNQQAWLISSTILELSGLEFKHFSGNEFLRHFTEKSLLGRDGPVYKYIHLITPHPPLVVAEGNLPAKVPLEGTRENYKRQAAFTLDRVVTFLDKIRTLAIYDPSMIVIQSDHGGGYSFKMQEAGSGRWIDSLKSELQVWGGVLPLLLVKPAKSREPLKVSEAQVELNDLPATVTALLGLPEDFGGKNVFAVKSGEERQRRFYREMSHRSRAGKTGYFEALQEYVISGSVFQKSSWRIGKIYRRPAAYRNRNYLWGTSLGFGYAGNVHRFLLDGWSGPGKRGNWTRAKAASLGLEVDHPKNDVVLLSATMSPFLVQDRLPQQRVLVHINGKPVGEWTLAEKSFSTYSIAVPATHFQDKEVVIRFEFPNAASPKEMGLNRDVRLLAAHFRDIRLRDGHGP